ncbi:MAG: phenylacetate--CoA ligase family protein [Phycisphaerae bacterium]|nr:phenylacetate--CoA ligase family protein [Phycisphaerae bacterium]
MFGILARQVLLPVHERLLGRPTLRLAAELEASQWRSPAEIRALQGEKLGALLNHAARHTRFYRDRFAQAGVDVLRDDPFEVLLKLPVLKKAEIRANIEKMVWAEVAGGLHPFDTGGSSGEPLRFFVCRRRQAADQAARIRTHRWFGAEFGDRELYLWGSPIELRRTDRYKAWRDRLFNHRLLSAFDMSPARLDAYFDELDRFRPHCIFGYPSSLALLANYGRSRGRAGNLESLKAVFVTGEVCFPHDRENLEDYFQCPVADGYGARDAGFLAHECPDGGMHINAEQVFIEILRDGRPVEAGESGEIVVTHLDALGMPLIRYQTGDVGRLQVGRCTCGRGLPLMDVVEGRTTDFVHLPDGTRRHALAVIYPLREREDVGAFRIRQRVNYVVQVEVSGVEGRGAPDREAIATAVGRAVGGDIPVRVEVVNRITASASGKFQYVRSEVAQGRVAWEPACVAGLAKGAGHGA